MYNEILTYCDLLANFFSYVMIIQVFFFNFVKPKLFYQYLFKSLRKQQLRGIMLNMYVFNLITFTKLCSLLTTFFNTQQAFQCCLNISVRVIRRRKVGQCQINVEIYNVGQRRINVVYFNVDINNVRQRRNNAVILNVEFHNVDQHQNNILNMTIFKKLQIGQNYF